MSRPKTRKVDETPEFCAFWDTWRPFARHTDGRGEAREVFFQHVRRGADPQDIVDGAKCFFRTMKEKDRDYVPLAATWLNKGAYEDLAIIERAHQQRMAEASQRRIEAMKTEASVSETIDPERRAEMVARAKAVMNGKVLQ